MRGTAASRSAKPSATRFGRPLPTGRRRKLRRLPGSRPRAAKPLAGSRVSILSSLNMEKKASKKVDEEIEKQQGRLNLLERKARAAGVSSILVFEGWDAAGKGGAIRRVTAALDARDYRVIPIAAPTDEERAQHYLWRFWRHLGRAGRVTIFDRSWYGRVLVERVEGFATEKAWMRAYAEINQFEDQLADHGIVLQKYWLHVTKQEQLRRFKEREATPHKQWKLTPEDWRNRDRWQAYEDAVNDMIERTSTRNAPWTLVEANDKDLARLKVLKTMCDHLEKRLGKQCRMKRCRMKNAERRMQNEEPTMEDRPCRRRWAAGAARASDVGGGRRAGQHHRQRAVEHGLVRPRVILKGSRFQSVRAVGEVSGCRRSAAAPSKPSAGSSLVPFVILVVHT